MKPGTYIEKRREAAGLTLADVAARFSTEPRIAQHLRAEWLERIESDEQPASSATIVALGAVYPIDFAVLLALIEHDLGLSTAPLPQLCERCAHKFSFFRAESRDRPGLCIPCADRAGAGR